MNEEDLIDFVRIHQIIEERAVALLEYYRHLWHDFYSSDYPERATDWRYYADEFLNFDGIGYDEEAFDGETVALSKVYLRYSCYSRNNSYELLDLPIMYLLDYDFFVKEEIRNIQNLKDEIVNRRNKEISDEAGKEYNNYLKLKAKYET